MNQLWKLTVFTCIGIIMLGISGINASTADKPCITSSLASTNNKSTTVINNGIQTLNQRSIHIKASNHQVQIESIRVNGNSKDVIISQISTSKNILQITMEYATSNDSSNVEMQLTTSFINLIEFVDRNDDGYYTNGTDDIASILPLTQFLPISSPWQVMQNDNAYYYFKVETTDHVFTANFIMSENFSTINGSFVSPTELKVGIDINNFPYSINNSLVALETRLSSSNNFNEENETEDSQLGYATGEEQVKTTENNGHSGFFSWNESATIDNSIRSISTSPIVYNATASSEELYVCYPRGNSIEHDPEIGISGLIFQPGGTSTVSLPLVIIVICIIAIISIFGLMMTKEEYRDYLLTRSMFINKGAHRLSLEDVLDNECRSKILNCIVEKPGIHFNELLRQVNTSPSNLAWHLDILEAYRIIHKQRVGHYLVFYSYLEKNPFSILDVKIAKSKTTLEIFQLISDTPGMYQNEIARRMGIDHKTAKYHLDKLIEASLIRQEKDGRKTRFVPISLPNEL